MVPSLSGLEIGNLRVDVRERARKQSPLAVDIAQIVRVTVLIGGTNPRLPSGDQSAVEPPGPIPNPEVKRRSADGSETIGLVRVGRRQVYARLQAIGAGLFFLRGWRGQGGCGGRPGTGPAPARRWRAWHDGLA